MKCRKNSARRVWVTKTKISWGSLRCCGGEIKVESGFLGSCRRGADLATHCGAQRSASPKHSHRCQPTVLKFENRVAARTSNKTFAPRPPRSRNHASTPRQPVGAYTPRIHRHPSLHCRPLLCRLVQSVISNIGASQQSCLVVSTARALCAPTARTRSGPTLPTRSAFWALPVRSLESQELMP